MAHPINILERYWNFTSFRPLQEEIITSVLQGEDTFVLLPTGGGKSMCFQIPALIKDGICIVISPLIALMNNQVNVLKGKGIKAMALTSGIPYSEIDTMLDNCIYGNYKFLYLSPERLQQDLVQQRIKQMNVNLIAVDEAHCISQWGNDFRPAYKNIVALRQLHPQVNIVALTASATSHVVADIVKELDFLHPKIFKDSFFRKNLAYMTFHEEDKLYKLEAILKKNKAPSIVYVRSRKATVDINNFIKKIGLLSHFYHGGLSNSEKESRLEAWLNNKFQIMVATNAFGMGIDKPDVKTVIHLNLPDSIESYFQEAGRAGRNGDKAYAVILKNKNDETLVKNQFLNVLPTVDYIKSIYKRLNNYFQISYGEATEELFAFNFNHFCTTYKLNTTLTYNTLLALERTGIINLNKQFNNKTKIQFIINNNALLKYLEGDRILNNIVKTILRTYGGLFEQETVINTTLIAKKISITEETLIKTLVKLSDEKIITLYHSKTDAEIIFLEPREDDKTINRVSKIIQQQTSLRQHQIASVLNYVNTDTLCKSKQLLSYFGNNDSAKCGICSVCINNKKSKPVDTKLIKNKIIKCLEKDECSSRDLVKTLKYPEEHLLNTLQELLALEIIMITKKNTYKLAHT